jgi:hypothetical protein
MCSLLLEEGQLASLVHRSVINTYIIIIVHMVKYFKERLRQSRIQSIEV